MRDPRIAVGTLYHRIRIRTIRRLRHRRVVLFERHGGIGDIVCTFPSVLALRKRHPDAVFVYSVWAAFKPIVEMGRVADYVVEKDWSDTMPKVRYYDYDMCYIPWLEDEQPRGRTHVHLIDDFSETLGVQPASRQPKLFVPARVAAHAQRFVASLRGTARHVVALHTGPSWPVREWTREGWERVVRRLRAETDCVVLQVGSDTHTGKEFVRTPRVIGTVDCIDRLTLVDTIGVLEQIDVLAGIDSGLLHAAGAVGTPCVGVFGAIDPRLRLPPETPTAAVTSTVPCLGCHHRLPRLHWRDGCPHGIVCMQTINPDAVVERIIALLVDRRKSTQS